MFIVYRLGVSKYDSTRNSCNIIVNFKKFQEYESQMSERMGVYARQWRPT